MLKIGNLIVILSIFQASIGFADPGNCYEKLSNLFEHEKMLNLDHKLGSVFQVTNLSELEQLYGMGDLSFIHQNLLQSRYNLVNKITLELANNYTVNKPSSAYTISKVFDGIKAINRNVTDKIPEKVCERQGFCYGRAMVGHLLATKMGIPQENMKKVWVFGNLKADNGGIWNYHVALAIRSDDTFWVLDTSFGLKRLDDFLFQFQEENEITPLMFITQPTRSGPSRASIYNTHSFKAERGEPGYNQGYYKYAIEEIDNYNNFQIYNDFKEAN